MNFFKTFFLRTSLANIQTFCFPDCGCKDTAYFLLSKLFLYFFILFLNPKCERPLNQQLTYTTKKKQTFKHTIYKYRYIMINICYDHLSNFGNTTAGSHKNHKRYPCDRSTIVYQVIFATISIVAKHSLIRCNK